MILLEQARDPKSLNSLALAYIGDAIYEVYIRRHLIQLGQVKPNILQKESIKYVSARAQSYCLHQLINDGLLNDEELAIVRRGRNAKGHKAPKNTDIQTYRYSTAFEALIGHLYLQVNMSRLEEIILATINILESKERR